MDVMTEIVWCLFVFVAIVFCIFGFEALFIDVYYFYYVIHRYFKTKKYTKLTYEELVETPEQKIAITVPCWHEANVIGNMLTHNTRVIDYKNYCIFVGVYPNDPDTTNIVQKICEQLPNVRCIVQNKPGPTTKADNLNGIYNALLEEEAKTGEPFAILLLHDSEDMIHPLSLKLYNHLIPKKDMVQTPVFPLKTNYLNFTHWIYNDEFAEHHLKNLVVREAIGGLVPSAGVGTAFSRKAINTLIQSNRGPGSDLKTTPFDVRNLTEDYHSALLLKLAGLKTIFVKQWMYRTHRVGNLFTTQRVVKEYVATRAHFPMEYMKSVRQKSRWIIGITLQEWEQTGWKGTLPVLYCLFQDRRSLLTLLAAGLAYLILPYWIGYTWWQSYHPLYPTVNQIFDGWPPIHTLILLSTLLMIERMLQRMYACWKIYGLLPALLSLPRAVYGNLLNLHATLRAYRLYLFKPKTRPTLVWDKTDHTFAENLGLHVSDKKIGEYLIEEGFITEGQRIAVLNEQGQTGKKFGDILIHKGWIDKNTLTKILAEQYGIQALLITPTPLPRRILEGVTFRKYRWLMRHHILPIALEDDVLKIAIPDPGDGEIIQKAIQILSKYRLEYVLYYPQ